MIPARLLVVFVTQTDTAASRQAAEETDVNTQAACPSSRGEVAEVLHCRNLYALFASQNGALQPRFIKYLLTCIAA
jgi:hypothetical protein